MTNIVGAAMEVEEGTVGGCIHFEKPAIEVKLNRLHLLPLEFLISERKRYRL